MVSALFNWFLFSSLIIELMPLTVRAKLLVSLLCLFSIGKTVGGFFPPL